METGNKMKLYYWDIRGLAQPILYLLHYTGTSHEYVPTSDRKAWMKSKPQLLKEGLAFPNLPWLEDGDTKISESLAIQAYIIEKANRPDMLPNFGNFSEFLRIQGVMEDVRRAITGAAYRGKDKEGVQKLFLEYLEKGAPVIQGLDEVLAGKTWAMGDQLTMLDFTFVEMIEKALAMEKDLGGEVFGKCENLVAYMNRFFELPEIKAYRESDSFNNKPWNNTQAGWK